MGRIVAVMGPGCKGDRRPPTAAALPSISRRWAGKHGTSARTWRASPSSSSANRRASGSFSPYVDHLPSHPPAHDAKPWLLVALTPLFVGALVAAEQDLRPFAVVDAHRTSSYPRSGSRDRLLPRQQDGADLLPGVELWGLVVPHRPGEPRKPAAARRPSKVAGARVSDCRWERQESTASAAWQSRGKLVIRPAPPRADPPAWLARRASSWRPTRPPAATPARSRTSPGRAGRRRTAPPR